mmetsp:Transcript_14622/g.61704  ORF Transcript_14622/g.61704 Transcript_14622/m.61704 type:complete len:213 (+) Transcript_14622:2078-2716(+)
MAAAPRRPARLAPLVREGGVGVRRARHRRRRLRGRRNQQERRRDPAYHQHAGRAPHELEHLPQVLHRQRGRGGGEHEGQGLRDVSRRRRRSRRRRSPSARRGEHVVQRGPRAEVIHRVAPDRAQPHAHGRDQHVRVGRVVRLEHVRLDVRVAQVRARADGEVPDEAHRRRRRRDAAHRAAPRRLRVLRVFAALFRARSRVPRSLFTQLRVDR